MDRVSDWLASDPIRFWLWTLCAVFLTLAVIVRILVIIFDGPDAAHKVNYQPLLRLVPVPSSISSTSTDSIKTSWQCFRWAAAGREKFRATPADGVLIDPAIVRIAEAKLLDAKLLFVFCPEFMRHKSAHSAVAAMWQAGSRLAALESADARVKAADYFEKSAYLAFLVHPEGVIRGLTAALEITPLNTDSNAVLSKLLERAGDLRAAADTVSKLVNALHGRKAEIEESLLAVPPHYVQRDLQAELGVVVAQIDQRLSRIFTLRHYDR